MSEDDHRLSPTREGEALLREWMAAQENNERARRDANRAECEVRNAETALAKWMLPPDAKAGEKICMWHGRRLIQVEVTDGGPRVSIRAEVKP